MHAWNPLDKHASKRRRILTFTYTFSFCFFYIAWPWHFVLSQSDSVTRSGSLFLCLIDFVLFFFFSFFLNPGKGLGFLRDSMLEGENSHKLGEGAHKLGEGAHKSSKRGEATVKTWPNVRHTHWDKKSFLEMVTQDWFNLLGVPRCAWMSNAPVSHVAHLIILYPAPPFSPPIKCTGQKGQVRWAPRWKDGLLMILQLTGYCLPPEFWARYS